MHLLELAYYVEKKECKLGMLKSVIPATEARLFKTKY